MLSQCAFHRPTLLKATAALMGVAVEKESKVPVMRAAGVELVKLLKVGCVCENTGLVSQVIPDAPTFSTGVGS